MTIEEERETIALISGPVDDFLFTGWSGYPTVRHGTKLRNKSNKNSSGKNGNKMILSSVVLGFEPMMMVVSCWTRYLDEIQEIQIPRTRKLPKEETTDPEKTELQGLLGALSWHAGQVGYS